MFDAKKRVVVYDESESAARDLARIATDAFKASGLKVLSCTRSEHFAEEALPTPKTCDVLVIFDGLWAGARGDFTGARAKPEEARIASQNAKAAKKLGGSKKKK